MKMIVLFGGTLLAGGLVVGANLASAAQFVQAVGFALLLVGSVLVAYAIKKANE